MKKLLAMLLALVCVFSFAACASKNTNDTTEPETPSTSDQQPETPAEQPDETPADDGASDGVNIDTPAVMPDDGFPVEGSAAQEPEENAPAAEGGTGTYSPRA